MQTGYTKAEQTAWNSYNNSVIAAQTAYANQYKSIETTYQNTAKTAENTYTTTVVAAENAYNDEVCRLAGRFYDAIGAINSGGTVTGTFYSNGTSSVDVQVCFVAGTPILLTDGTSKSIEEMEVGDEVFARPHDNPTGELASYRVARVFQNDPQSIYELKFENGLEIRATKEHPFYVDGRGWVQTLDLEVGATCVSAEGEPVKLLGKRFIEEKVPVYNFEVEQAHTYHVGTSIKDSVLVHNTCPDCGAWGHPLFTCPVALRKVTESRGTTLFTPQEVQGTVVQPHIDRGAAEGAKMLASLLPFSGVLLDLNTVADSDAGTQERVIAGTSIFFSVILAGYGLGQTDEVVKVKSAVKEMDTPLKGGTQLATPVARVSGGAVKAADLSKPAQELAKGLDSAKTIVNKVGDAPKPVAKAAEATESKLTGQLHHPITKTISNTIKPFENISEEFKNSYRGFVTRARTLSDHKGYQTWHRELDNEIRTWLKGDPAVTETEFFDYLKGIYGRESLKNKFPEFLKDFDAWLKELK